VRFRLVTAAVALVLTATALSGCTGEPEPTEPTPAFSSEEEAFAAAEETYRAYVDALNRVDLSDPETFEDVFAWTTGEANAGARETFSEMHAEGLTVEGATVIALALPRPLVNAGDWDSVELDVCLDVSTVTLVDPSGESVVSPDRRDVQAMVVTLQDESASSTGFLISKIDGREGTPECVQ